IRYLSSVGYSVFPWRSRSCAELHGIPCVTSLRESDEPIDIVDVFRNPSAAPGHAREAAEVGARAFWLQLGLRSPEAREIATATGMDYVEDRSTAIVDRSLG